MDLSTREGRREQGERIKQAAREAGLTLDELARAIGCSRALIFQYASGASLAQPDRLQQISAVVRKPLHWFYLTGEGKQPGVRAATRVLDAERARLESEREHLTLEQARWEQRRSREDIAHLELLISASSLPADHRKVVDYCEQIQPLLAREADTERLAAVLLKQGNALIFLQEWGAARERLEHAAGLYRRSEKPALARDCMQSLGHANLMLGRVSEALQLFEGVADSEDWTNRWQGTLSCGAAHEMLGNFSPAIAAFENAIAIIEERGDPDGEVPRLYVEANWANLELDFGDYAQALERARLCIRIAQRHGVQDQYIEALLTAADALLRLDEPETAAAHANQALDLSQLIADRQHQSLALSCLSMYDTAVRNPDRAIARGKEALALAMRCNGVRAETLAQRTLCEAYLLAGNPSEALYHAEQGQAMAASIRLNLPHAQFGALKSSALLQAGRVEDALSAAIAALAAADQLQARPIQLESCMAASRASLAAADFGEAERYAAVAIVLAESMGLPHILWRAHAAACGARAAGQPSAANRAACSAAVELLRESRRRRESRGESSTMEDPDAAALWRLLLAAVLTEEGAEAALRLAETADWPPLTEWVVAYSQNEGGPPNV